jgi:hypothetical protein
MDNKNQKIIKGIGIFCILVSLFSIGVSLWRGDGFSSAILSLAGIGLLLIVLSTQSAGGKK